MSQVPKKALKVDLPPGFYLKEYKDIVVLFYRGTLVATFSATSVDPKKIREKALYYAETYNLLSNK